MRLLLSKEMIIAAPLTAREQLIPHRHAEKLTYMLPEELSLLDMLNIVARG